MEAKADAARADCHGAVALHMAALNGEARSIQSVSGIGSASEPSVTKGVGWGWGWGGERGEGGVWGGHGQFFC